MSVRITYSPDLELWAPIPDYLGLYSVSNLGRVKSHERQRPGGRGGTQSVRERILSAPPDYNGYPKVTLCADGRRKAFKVCALVLLAFVGPCPDGLEVSHVEDDKLDSRLSELAVGKSADKAWAAARIDGKVYAPGWVPNTGAVRDPGLFTDGADGGA